MREVTVIMKTIENVKQFVDIVSKYSEDMNLVRGNYVVDAKSIMGIFSLDLTKPVILTVDTSSQRFEQIRGELNEYIA